MKVKRYQGDHSPCVLTKVDQGKVEDVTSLVDQLSHHYRETAFGDEMAIASSKLKGLLQDTDIAPHGVDAGE